MVVIVLASVGVVVQVQGSRFKAQSLRFEVGLARWIGWRLEHLLITLAGYLYTGTPASLYVPSAALRPEVERSLS